MNKEFIPNSLTMANGFFGFISIIMTFNGKYTYAAICIILSVLADRYDGIVARKLNVVSAIGKELDSICDIISFGVAPSFLIFVKAKLELDSIFVFFAAIICSLYVCCGAFRLARFNVTTMADGYYQGVPITTCGLFLAFLSFFNDIPIVANLIMTLIFAYLMVSKIKIKKI